MPAKVNPTQREAMAMVCTQVIGLDAAVAIAGSSGHLQMNSFKPLIGFNLLHSIDLLHDACRSCRKSMVEGLQINKEKIEKYLSQSLMLVTALTPEIGYEKACQIAQFAHKNKLSLQESASQLGFINKDVFERVVDPKLMAKPHEN